MRFEMSVKDFLGHSFLNAARTDQLLLYMYYKIADFFVIYISDPN
jgi:hypothetical protein